MISALTNNLMMQDQQKRYNVLKNYFTAVFSYKDICNFLFRFHRIKIAIPHLNRLLRQCNLQRRGNHSNIKTVIKFNQDELKGSSSCFGYRYMLQKLRSSGLTAVKETVRLILKSLDPVAVDRRKGRKLTRREYHSFGPNHTWNIDGYDRLKPFGIAIHGAIDGFSRRILSLKLSLSNNNPKVIVNYYLCCVKELNLIPRFVRGDRGTENVRNHTDSQSKDRSFIYGHSTANQRIESWWSQLFKSMTSWWITFFKDMVVNGLFDIFLNLHLQCLRFCFFGVLQHELDEIKSPWNSHRIRHIKNSNSPDGRPDVLYFTPEDLGVTDCKFPLDSHDVNLAMDYCETQSLFGCSADFLELSRIIMQEKNLTVPKILLMLKLCI